MTTSIQEIPIGPNDDPVEVLEHHLLEKAMNTYAVLLDDDNHEIRMNAANRVVDLYGRSKTRMAAQAFPSNPPPALQQFNFNLSQVGAAAEGMLRVLERAAVAGPGTSLGPVPDEGSNADNS